MIAARVEVRAVSKRYGAVSAVQGLELTLNAGEILALVGPSGCGKTTALRLIAGLERLDQGSIVVDGQIVDHADRRHHVPPEKRLVGLVFQDYALFPHLTVGANIGYGVRGGFSKDEEVLRAAHLVGLEDVLDRFPHQLSGGQQQRVALARALAPRPEVLLLDEPFSNLDARRRAQMRREVRDILVSTGTTSLFVTHDQEEALYMGDRVAVMFDGEVAQVGTPEAVFHQPATLAVADFLGDTSFLSGLVTADGVATALGLLPQRVGAPPGTEVAVLVRPDDVDLLPDSTGTARVESRVFRGMHQHYRVRLADGEQLGCLTDHCLHCAPGDPVTIRVRACHALACFVNGASVVGEVLGAEVAPTGLEQEDASGTLPTSAGR